MLTNPTLKSKIDSLWDKFWSGGIANPLTAIEQMSYLIFLKRLEDKDNERKKAAERRNVEFVSVFGKAIGDLKKKDVEKCRWSYWTQLPGEEMLPFVRDVVFKFLRSLGSETSSFTQYMQDAVFIIPKASLLQESVKLIDDMHISEQNSDVQGDMYEYLLKNLTTSGKNGQFRTPRHIIRMIVKLVDRRSGKESAIRQRERQADGYSLDDKRDKVDANDIPDIIAQWNARRETRDARRNEVSERTSKSFYVPFEEIKENNYDLSINRYKEIVYEEVRYEKPEVILERINKIENEIAKELESIKEMI